MKCSILVLFYLVSEVAVSPADGNNYSSGGESLLLGRSSSPEDHSLPKFDGLILTPLDYMKRRRPTTRDTDKFVYRPKVSKIFHCKKGLPPPTKVQLSVHVSGISLVTNGALTMSAYLRYSWEDYRLTPPAQSMRGNFVEIAPTAKDSIWLPDLYIPNAASVISPVIFVPSTSFRMYNNATLFANQYLLLELACPFNYALFPMDVQVCDVALQSFGRNPCELNLTWSENNPLSYSTSTLSQFSYEIHRASASAYSRTFRSGSKGPLERAQVHMYVILKRQIMFYMMQIYIPSILFVVVSWVSFLIPAEMAQGRMLLTITTMLTMVSLFAAGSEYVPKASYVKAIDVWMCLCTFLSFFAVVNCLVDVRMESVMSGGTKKRTGQTFVLTGQARRQTVVEIFRKYAMKGKTSGDEEDSVERENDAMGKILMFCYKMQQGALYVYPIIFVLFNIIYWSVCLSHMEGPSESHHKHTVESGVKGAEVPK